MPVHLLALRRTRRSRASLNLHCFSPQVSTGTGQLHRHVTAPAVAEVFALPQPKG